LNETSSYFTPLSPKPRTPKTSYNVQGFLMFFLDDNSTQLDVTRNNSAKSI